MRPVTWLAPLLALLLVSAAAPPKPKSSALALKLTSELAHHQYQAAYSHFGAAMKAAMPPAQIAGLWKMLHQKVGAYESSAPRAENVLADHIVDVVNCKFGHQELGLQWAFDSQTLAVAGLLTVRPR